MPSGHPSDPPPSGPVSERALFLEALEIPDSRERSRFLDVACAGKPGLRASLEDLLRCHRDDTFLEDPVVALPKAVERPDPSGAPLRDGLGPGDSIGRYKLLQQIGEGGAGTVFMAEQEEPVRRRVALKIIKAGMDTKSVIARFETERQALAMMDHPNIAKVLDAGSTATGRPFFVMELVRGTRLTTYCDNSHLSTRQRLRLFIQVCQAIQHAHQKGIIHRDIKPSNILVTLHDGIPVPKVIDFGIAKAIDQRLTDKTVFTEFQAFIGTPAYMSPEQAEMSGLDIDTRSDVYSLGVLLYEMLTGRTPFDPQELTASGLDGMRRTLRERDPLAPSTRLRTMVETERTTTAGRQRIEPSRLVGLLSGDLDWIVMKALEKDRTRRYPTALGLAQDVQSYLDDEPVTARPPTAWYRMRKLARRNRVAVAVSGAFAAALVLGLALATWQFREKSAALQHLETIEREQRLLREQAERAQRAETQLRQHAQENEFRARQRAYAADLNLAQHALEVNNLGRARDVLARQIPADGEADLRGWEWRYLAGQCQSDALFALPRQSSEIVSLAVSADGRWIAAGVSGGDVVIFDIRSREEISRFPGGPDRPKVVFSPTASLLVFPAADTPSPPSGPPSGPGGGWRQRLRLWDPVERHFVRDLSLRAPLLGLAFSSDGTRLAAITADGQCREWNVDDGSERDRHALPGLRPQTGAAAFSADLRFAAYPVSSSMLRVCEVATERVLWTMRAADENLRALAFSPDGTLVASSAGFVESTVRTWDTATGTELTRLEGHRGWVGAVLFWPDGNRLASASSDQTIRFWNLAGLRSTTNDPPSGASSGEAAGSSREIATLRGHQLEVWSLALSPDRSTLVSGSKDGSILVWDTTLQRRDRAHVTLPEPTRAWTFERDQPTILTGDPRGRLWRWRGPEFQDGETIAEIGDGFSAQLFSPDARLAVAGGPPGQPLRVWDIEKRAPLAGWKSVEKHLFPMGFVTRPEARAHLITRRFPDGLLQEWDLEKGESLRSWPGRGGGFPGPGPGSPTFSTDAQWWFFDNDRGSGTLRRENENREASLELLSVGFHSAAFSPDLRRLAIVGGAGIGELWDIENPHRLATIKGFLQGLSSVTFSPDSKRLVIGSDGREALKLWDPESNLELLNLPADGSRIHAAAFSPNGDILGARSGRGTVFLWRALPQSELARALADPASGSPLTNATH